MKFFLCFQTKGLDSIDENSMTYAADIFFAQTWKDHRLRLPENMTSEYRLIEVDWLKNMWRPDRYQYINFLSLYYIIIYAYFIFVSLLTILIKNMAFKVGIRRKKINLKNN